MIRPPCLSIGLFLTVSLVMTGVATAKPVATILMQSGAVGGEADPWVGVEEMLVTGTGSLTAQDFADADSVVAFSTEDLQAVGAQDISDLADFTPNLEIVNSGATTPTFFIRGVGLNDFNSNSTGAVAIYQDGVAINAPAMQLSTLYDVEGVSVLRGPQGKGLNRNASAGAIRIRSKRPTGDFGGYLRADFGNYDFMDFEGALEAPIVPDVLSARVAFRVSQRDGFMTNRCAGAPPFGQRVPYPAGPAESFRGEGPWSLCGEVQPFVGLGDISDIPLGLEKDLNDLNNWAGRATFKYEPDVDALPMVWYLNFHGARRDEYTRVGQSYGTGGFFCRDGDICTTPFVGVPPDERGTISSGLFGGNQGRTGRDYQPPEVVQRLGKLAPCTQELSPTTGRRNTCSTLEAGESVADLVSDRTAENRAKIQVAKELARELDAKPYEGDFNNTGKTTNTVLGGFLSGEFELPYEISMSMTSAVDAYDRSINVDADFSPETLFHIITTDDGIQAYQDLLFEGEVDIADQLVKWDLSSFFLYEKLDVDVENDLGRDASVGVGSRSYTQEGWSAGVSLGLSWDFWDDFTLDGGARYNWDRKELDYVLFPGAAVTTGDEFTNLDDDWDSVTGTIRLTYRIREDTQLFWKFTRGWKPGTYNATSGQGRPVTTASPEKIDSFEAGLRGAWFDERVKLDGSLFYYKYENYQIFTTQQFLGGNTEFVTLNANDAEVYGAEVEATAKPFEYSEFGLLFSWLESQFLDFVQVNSQLAPGGVFFQEIQNSGNQLLNSPKFKVILRAIQQVPLGDLGTLSLRYDGVWTDDTFFDASEGRGLPNLVGEQFLPENTIGQRAYWLHNLRLSWLALDGNLEAALWVRNLTDEVYKTFAFDASAFQNTTVHFTGDPRTYGTSLSVRF